MGTVLVILIVLYAVIAVTSAIAFLVEALEHIPHIWNRDFSRSLREKELEEARDLILVAGMWLIWPVCLLWLVLRVLWLAPRVARTVVFGLEPEKQRQPGNESEE